jgi:hypothetical protein
MTPVLTGLVLLLVALPATAQKPPEPIQLTLHPKVAPVPALKYRLLPELSERTPGNRAFLYYRAFSPEWFSVLRTNPKEIEKIDKARKLPLDQLSGLKIDWLIGSKMLKEVDRAARRAYIDWEMTQRIKEEGLFMLLPDVQAMREFATLLAARARLEMAAGKLDQAFVSLETGMQLGRDVADAPTVIQALVGTAIATVMLEQAETLIQQPGAPNLYWALTALPRPFIDLRKPLEGDQLMVSAYLPEIKAAGIKPLSETEIQKLVNRIYKVIVDDNLNLQPKRRFQRALADFIKEHYPQSRRGLLAQGYTAQQVDALPHLQAVIFYMLQEFARNRDDVLKWTHFSFPEAYPQLRKAEARAQKAAWTVVPYLRDLLPIASQAYLATTRLDRRIAALRCIEALRLHAAAHEGKLPASLDDVTLVPIPRDPVTGKPFEYRRTKAGATLHAPPPPGEIPAPWNVPLTYEIKMKR